MSIFFTDVKGTRERLREAENRLRDKGISASCVLQGKVLEYKVHHHRTAKVGADRGEITDFSNAARLRMLKNFNRIDFSLSVRPLFITLTYPDELATPMLDERNMHRKIMARRLEKVTGKPVPASWRIEWCERKSGELIGKPCPHWHLLVFRHEFIPWQEVREAWARTIGHDGYVRTDIRRVDERGAVQLYMAKYISKDALPPSLVIAAYQNKLGRAYGWLRKAQIPWHPKTERNALTDGERQRLTAFAAERHPMVREGLETSFTLLGEPAIDGGKILDNLPLTEGR